MKIISDTFWTASSKIVNILVLVISLRVMTTLLPPSEYSKLVLLTSIQNLAGLVLISPLGQYYNRHIHEWSEQGTLSIRSDEYSIYWFFSSLIAGTTAFIWFGGVVSFAMADILIFLIISLSVFASTEIGMLANKLNMLNHRRESCFIQIKFLLIGLVFSTCICMVSNTSIAWLAGQAFAALIIILTNNSNYNRDLATKFFVNLKKGNLINMNADMRKFCLPLFATSLLFWIEGNSYKFLIEPLWDAQIFASFIISLSIPAQISGLSESFINQLVCPPFYKSIERTSSKSERNLLITDYLNFMMPLYLNIAGLVLALSPTVIAVVVSSKYHLSTSWVWIGVVLELTRLTGNSWQIISQVEKNFVSLLLPFCVGSVGVIITALSAVHYKFPPVYFGMLLVVIQLIKCIITIRSLTKISSPKIDYARVTCAAFTFFLSLGAYLISYSIESLWLKIISVILISGVILVQVWSLVSCDSIFRKKLMHYI